MARRGRMTGRIGRLNLETGEVEMTDVVRGDRYRIPGPQATLDITERELDFIDEGGMMPEKRGFGAIGN